MDKKEFERKKKILLEQMKSKNNLVCALLPLDRGIMQRVWQEVFHPPLCCVWSPLQQHLSGDNLEKMLPLPFDMLLCWDLEDANHPELFPSSKLHHSKLLCFSVSNGRWLAGMRIAICNRLCPSQKTQLCVGSISAKQKKTAPNQNMWSYLVIFRFHMGSDSVYLFLHKSGLIHPWKLVL